MDEKRERINCSTCWLHETIFEHETIGDLYGVMLATNVECIPNQSDCWMMKGSIQHAN
jgi:hypothetical protein